MYLHRHDAHQSMPRRYLRRILPSSRKLHEEGAIRVFGRLLHNPNLWHLNRHSVAMAVALGLFTAFVPVPGQTLIAVAGAVMFGCNLPIAVVVVFVSNPVTMPPLFFTAYKLGAWLLSETPRSVQFELSVNWLVTSLTEIWQPFLLGCFAMGLICALFGYVAVQIIWRIHVLQSWRERRKQRRAHRVDAPSGGKLDDSKAGTGE
jgi:uncharacterized protein (DUF2062 family)